MTPHERAEIQATVRDAVKEAVTDALPGIVEEQMPLAIGEVLAPLISDQMEKHPTVVAAKRSQRRQAVWRTLVMVGYLIMFLGLSYTIHDSRERSIKSRGVVCEILTGGDATLYAYQREGTITERQLRRGLRQSAEYREKLGPAPACVSTLTPEPRRLPPVPSARP